jgi:hypothetical protein
MCVKGGSNRRRAEEIIAHVAQRTHWLMTPPDKRAPLPLEVAVPDVEDDSETRVSPEPGVRKSGKGPAKVKPQKKAQRMVERAKRTNAVD